jgi:hypothetical protein
MQSSSRRILSGSDQMSNIKKVTEPIKKINTDTVKIKTNSLAKNRELVYKALTNPSFRKQLQEQPELAIGKKQITDANKKEIKRILEMVREIDTRIGSIADELLCANGGPCGIA